jgi:hypothetical protein
MRRSSNQVSRSIVRAARPLRSQLRDERSEDARHEASDCKFQAGLTERDEVDDNLTAPHEENHPSGVNIQVYPSASNMLKMGPSILIR